mgnify:CR=1 FL=1|tara:strand:- start:53 stop:199 length:147 start_codon:yes stop_codon:yes gene_type:complete
MGKTLTLKDEYESKLKPRTETIQFILNYSKAYTALKTKDGMDIELISN